MTVAHAQEMTVKSFYLAETDLTAMTRGTMEYDQNGNLCALIKVETTLKDFTFEVGVLGITKTVFQTGEIWLYVPFGIRKLTIKHPEFGLIRDYPLTCGIEKGKTYILKLDLPLTSAVVRDPSKKQKVRLQVYPKDASVEINGGIDNLDADGALEKVFSYGLYDLIVSAPRYHSIRQRMVVNETTEVLNIHLKQAFGWLDVSGEGDEKLFVDDKPVAFSPGTPIELMSGHYKVLLEKPLYKPYETVIEIRDSVVCNIVPDYVPNHRDLEFNVSDDAEIWVDNVKMGIGKWRGKLEYGQHRIECRKPSHRSTELVLNVEPNTTGPIALDAPIPQYGTLILTSDPTGSRVTINGEYVGSTPTYIPNHLIGEYIVSVAGVDKKIQLSENKEITLNFDSSKGVSSVTKDLSSELTSKQFVKIVVNPSDAALEVNGEVKQTNKGVYEELLPLGKYQYTVRRNDYHDSNGVFELGSASVPTVRVDLKPAFGYLSVPEQAKNSVKGDKVYVDGVFVAYAPVSKMQFSSGTHTIRIVKQNHYPYEETFTLNDEEELSFMPKFVPITGSLTVITKPFNAKIYIDGNYVGNSNKNVKNVIVGQHDVNVELDGYYRQIKKAIIRENRDTTISFTLRKMPLTPAQYDMKYNNRGVINSLEFKYSFSHTPGQIVYKNLGVQNYKSLYPLEFNYLLGFRFSNWFSLSLGSGVTYETVDLRNSGDEFATYYYENQIDEIVNYSNLLIPAFVNSKIYLSRGKYQPMLSVSAGLYLAPKVKCMALFDFGAGLNYRINSLLNCYMIVGAGTTPILKGSVDVHSNRITATRTTAFAPQVKLGIML